ncbi:MAG: hypothetical protein SVU32_04465 [Candidatus Nanohaloarchaea archaeon]|nr:hypothetical protein [Candidatus Nanohaloarchaea archaeon]
MRYESHGQVVDIDVPDGYEDEVDDWIEHFVPGIEETDAEPDYTVHLEQGEEAGLQYDEDEAVITSPEERFHPMDAVMMGARAFEKQYNEDETYSLHSSSVTDGEHSVLITGEANTGKTTTALKLCRDYDLSIISGDRTLIQDRKAVEGTKKLRLRTGSLLEEFDLGELVDERPDDIWQETGIYTGEDLDVEEADGEYPVQAVYFVKKVPGDMNIDTFDLPESLIEYSRQASMFSRSHPELLYGPGQPVPVLEDEEDGQMRIEEAEHLLEDVDCYTLSGELEDISEEIYRREFSDD